MIESVSEYLVGVHDVAVGRRTVQGLLAETDNWRDWPRTIKGREYATGLPKAVEVSLDEMAAVLREIYGDILRACDRALSEAGCDTSQEMDIILAGGASETGGLHDALSSHFGKPVVFPPEPGNLSARGLAGCSAEECFSTPYDKDASPYLQSEL